MNNKINECGSASVVVIAIAVMCLLIISSISTVGNYMLTRARTHNAADASALAGAQAVASFKDNPCNDAKEIADSNSVELISCNNENNIVEVTVKSKSHFVVTAKSRAEIEL